MQFEREEALGGARPGGHRQQPLNPFDVEDIDLVAVHVPAVSRSTNDQSLLGQQA